MDNSGTDKLKHFPLIYKRLCIANPYSISVKKMLHPFQNLLLMLISCLSAHMLKQHCLKMCLIYVWSVIYRWFALFVLKMT